MNMKEKIPIVVLVFTLFTYRLLAHEGRVTVRAVDESGLPIASAKVELQFTLAGLPGAGWGDYQINNIYGVTDTNGICTLTGKGDQPTASAGVFKEGYYGESAGVTFTNTLLGRWQLWNPTIEVVLKKIGVQVPMYARKIWKKDIPAQGKPVGFDLMVGDWIVPYGKGEMADFLFQLDIGPTETITTHFGPHKLFDNKLTIHFSNDGDGIQSAVAYPHGGLRLSRQAPLESFEPSLVKRVYRDDINKMPQTNIQSDANYFFRVRTKRVSNGNITSALYGKIHGDFDNEFQRGKLTFTYYLNSEPNSRNMEFDPKKNLFKNLKPLEQVTAP